MVTGTTRSRAYPALDLEKAIEVLRRQVEGLAWGAHDREAISRALGYKNGPSGQAARKIAALSHFGLLERKKGLYRPTQLARKLLEASDETAKAARRAAFLKPKLFREVIEAHEPDGRLPGILASVLVREHGIAEAVKDDVAAILLESGQFAGVLGPDGELIPRGGPLADQPLAFPAPQGTLPDPAEVAASGGSNREGEMDHQVIRVVLTGAKRAELILPTGLNQTDVLLLRKQLEFLELQAQANAPTSTGNVLPYPSRTGRP